jgi:hypothetical protein
MVSFSNTETSAVQKFINNEAKEFIARIANSQGVRDAAYGTHH